jgi:hypothetical protein
MEPEVIQEVVVEEKDDKQSPEYSEVEQSAIAQGWKPKDKWDGPEDEWVSAKAFIKFGDVQSQLKQVKQEATQKEKVIKSMKDHYVKVKDDAKKEVLDTLKRHKREALKQEDYARVAELDLQLDELQTNLDNKFKASDTQVQQVEASNVPPAPEFVDWQRKNNWYVPGETTGISADADAIGLAYAHRTPGAKPIDVLKYVETTIKRMYPEKFTNPARREPAAVDEGVELVVESKGKSKVRLTEAEKEAARNFGLTEEAYAAGLKQWEKQKGLA